MKFKATKGIYLQIAENLCNQILDGKLQPNERVPSVRDLATELEVNRNTVMRTYTYLEERDVFSNKRGVGFFVSESAKTSIKKNQKEEFIKEHLPQLIEKVRLLKLNNADLKDLISEIKSNDKDENK